MPRARSPRLQPKPVAGFDRLAQAGAAPSQELAGLAVTVPEAPADAAGPPAAAEAAVEPSPTDEPSRMVVGGPSPTIARRGTALPAGEREALPGERLDEPSQLDGTRHYKRRTSDMVPIRVKTKVQADQKRGLEASTVIVLAFGRAIQDGQIPRLVAGYRGKGQQTSPFGPHVRARQTRGMTTTRLQYNPWDYEDDGIKKLVEQYGVSRAVLVSLVLAYHYGLDPAIV